MKTILKKSGFMLMFVLSFAIQSVSQTNPYVITVDTLENEQAIVTLERTDGLFYSQYLFLEPPYELNLTESTDNTTYTDDDPDVFWGNIEFPNEFGACMPRDIFYNSLDSSYYVYGGKKIIIIDGYTKEKTGEILISDTEISFNSIVINLNPENRITGNQNPSHPLIYCATEDGKLVIIDANTNQIVNEILIPEDLSDEIKTSVIFSTEANAAFWYISSGINGVNRITRIVNQNETNSILVDYGITDILCDPEEPNLYVSTTNGIYSYSTIDLSLQQTLTTDGTGCMVFGTNKLYAHKLDSYKIFYYDFNNPQPDEFDISFNNIHKMVYNPEYDKIYYTGTDDNPPYYDGVRIAYQEIEVQMSQSYNYETTIGLVYNSDNNNIYCGSFDWIVAINGGDDDIYATERLDKSYCYDLETDGSDQIISMQNISGNALLFDQDFSTIETINLGGLVIGGCVKENEIGMNKSYFTVYKNNFNSYLIEIDNNSNQVLNEFEIQYDFKPEKISCNKENDYLYILGRDNLNNNVLLEFNCVVGSFFQIPIVANLYIERIFAAPNDKLYVGISDATVQKLIIIEPYTYYTDEIFLTGACYPDMKYYDGNIYIASSCSHKIYIIDGEDNSKIEIPIDPPPFSICFDETENMFYVGRRGLISKYDIDFEEGFDYTISNVYEYIEIIISNPYSLYVYGLSSDNLNVVNTFNGDLIKYEHKSYSPDMNYSNINDRLYLNSLYNDEKKANIKVWDCMKNEVINTLYLDNNFNNIGSQTPGVTNNVSGLNKLYTSNKCFSNISVIDCYTDTLDLYTGWTWVSFPRLERGENDPSLTEPILERIECFPIEVRLIDQDERFKYYNLLTEEWYGILNEVKSTTGYKLFIDEQGYFNTTIDLYGVRLDPETQMRLEPDVENWVGYFLEGSQYPIDAFGEEWMNENLYMIQTQFWTMIKEYNGEEFRWVTDGNITPFKYGDMVNLITDKTYPVYLEWNNSGQAALPASIPQPEYFSFEEKADYIPFYVEFDSTSDIQEIAIIADGEYKGAAVRLEGDTIIELNAYLEGTPAGAPLEFETWNGFKASNVKGNHLVFDNQLQTNVKRQIYAGENRQYYVISLREGEEFNIPEKLSEAYCRPNPFTGETIITFRLNKSQNTKVEIFNLSGKSIKTLMEGEFPAGLYNLEWKGDNSEGKKVKEGVYFYRINCGNEEVISGKIVKIK